MKIIAGLILTFFLSVSSFAQGIEFFHGKWKEGVEQAKAEEKLVFVDAYAVWCGPCKRMARNTFPKKEVGDFFNKHFVNLKIDAEKGDGISFRKKYPVSAFPTLYFLDANGKVIFSVKGAQTVDKLLALGKKALNKADYSVDLQKQYDDGNREPDFLFSFIKALNKSNKSSLKIANEYLETQDNLDTPFNHKFIFESMTEVDSKIFDYFLKYQNSIEQLVDKEAIQKKVEKACNKTLDKAIEYDYYDLVKEAQTKFGLFNKADAKMFALSSDMYFYSETNEVDKYLSASKKYVKAFAKKDAKFQNQLARDILKKYGHEKAALVYAENLAKSSYKLEKKSVEYAITYVQILKLNKKNDTALKIANKLLPDVDDPREAHALRQLIDQMK